MSSSSKKQLRKEKAAAELTAKQLKEQQEAKKVKRLTVIFIVILAVAIAAAAITVGLRAYRNSGIPQRNTTALTVGEHEISAAELNYHYVDALNSFYSSTQAYASSFGMDVLSFAQSFYGIDLTLPLNVQSNGEEDGGTWADSFTEMACDTAKEIYTIYDEAIANNFELPEEAKKQISATLEALPQTAKDNGFKSVPAYLSSFYGAGANIENFEEYYTKMMYAEYYTQAYNDSLVYTDDELRAYEAENPYEYSSFSYAMYPVNKNSYLEGGNTDNNGVTTYSAAEKAAALEKAKEVADSLMKDYDNLDKFNEAIAALDVNKDNASAAAYSYIKTAYDNLADNTKDWVADPDRKAGDMVIIPTEVENTDANGSTTTETTAYNVLYFIGREDNLMQLKNIRHILIGFEGGTTDASGNTTYTDEEKAAAKTAAEELLAQWEAGAATEESFAALVEENTTDGGSKFNGGLYEDVYPGQMVDGFDDWCYDENRKPGDTGIVETTYGYHVMYFSGDSEINYRDFMIMQDLKTAAVEEWRTALLDAATVEIGNTSLLDTSMTIMPIY